MKTHLKKWTLLGCLLTFIQLNVIYACQCPIWIEYFCGIVNERHIIVRAEIIDSLRFDMKTMRILDNLNKEIESNEVILWGQDGVNCGENLDLFSIGDTLILAVDLRFDSLYYLEGSCGLHYLRYSSGKVFTNIYPTVDTMDYQVFVDELLQCMDFSTSIKEAEESSPPVRFYPNPFTHEITIESSAEIGEGSVVLIYSIAGQLLRQEKFGAGTTKTLSMGDLQQGVYLVEIENDRGGRWTEKLVKED